MTGNGNHLNSSRGINTSSKYSGWEPKQEYIIENAPANMELRNYEMGLQKACMAAKDGLSNDKESLEKSLKQKKDKETFFANKIDELKGLLTTFYLGKKNVDSNLREVTYLLTDPNGVVKLNIMSKSDEERFFSLPLRKAPSEEEVTKYLTGMFEDKQIFKQEKNADGTSNTVSPDWAEKVCHLDKLNLINPKSAVNITSPIYTQKNEAFVRNTIKYIITLKNAYGLLKSGMMKKLENRYFIKLKEEIAAMEDFYALNQSQSRNDERETEYYKKIMGFVHPVKEYLEQINNVQENNIEARKIHDRLNKINVKFENLPYDKKPEVAHKQKEIIEQFYTVSFNDFKRVLFSIYTPTDETADLMDFLFGKEPSSAQVYGVPVKNLQAALKSLYKGTVPDVSVDKRAQKWFGVAGFGCDYVPKESQKVTLLRAIVNEESPLHIGLYTFCMYVRFMNAALMVAQGLTEGDEGNKTINLYNFYEKYFSRAQEEVTKSQVRDDVKTITQLSFLSKFVKGCIDREEDIKDVKLLSIAPGLADDFGGKYSQHDLEQFKKSKGGDVREAELKLKSFMKIEQELSNIVDRVDEKENARVYKSLSPDYLKQQVGYTVSKLEPGSELKTEPTQEAVDVVIKILTPGFKEGLINHGLIERIASMPKSSVADEFDVQQAALVATYKNQMAKLQNPDSSGEYQELISGNKKYEQFSEEQRQTIRTSVEKMHSLEQQLQMFKDGKLPFDTLTKQAQKEAVRGYMETAMDGQTVFGSRIPNEAIMNYVKEKQEAALRQKQQPEPIVDEIQEEPELNYDRYARELSAGKKFQEYTSEDQQKIKDDIQSHFNDEMQVTMFSADKLEYDVMNAHAQHMAVDAFMKGALPPTANIPPKALREYYLKQQSV